MENRITGVMIYYYFVCKRKLWYFCHEIRMEAENEDVILGKILDESSYSKNEKHINIDNIINIDAEAELTSMLSEYISQEIDLEILDMLIQNAQTTEYWSARCLCR